MSTPTQTQFDDTANGRDSQQSTSSTQTQTPTTSTTAAAEHLEPASTPPTSDAVTSQIASHDFDGPLSQLSQLAAAQEPLASRNPADARREMAGAASAASAASAGQKRTADGHIKAASNSPPTPNGLQAGGHKRTTSAFSSASSTTSKIGEVNNPTAPATALTNAP